MASLTNTFLSACAETKLPPSVYHQGKISFDRLLSYPNHILNNERSVFCEIIQLDLGTKKNIKHMVHAGADFMLRDKLGDTVLTLAIKHDRLNAIDILLAEGGDKYINKAHTKSFSWKSLLHLAVEKKAYDLAEKLITLGAHIHVRDQRNFTPLERALALKDIKMSKLLLDAGADVKKHEQKTQRSILPLVRELPPAPHKENTPELILLEMLLNAGADPDAKLDLSDQTAALLYYTGRGAFQAVKILLKAGANVHTQSVFHQTPFNLAAHRADIPMMTLLQKYGADVNHLPSIGITALGEALFKKDNLPMIQHLLNVGADVNQCTTKSGAFYYPLHIAVMEGNKIYLDLLLKHGADPLVEIPYKKQTPFLTALQKYGDDHAVTARLKIATDAAQLKQHRKGSLSP